MYGDLTFRPLTVADISRGIEIESNSYPADEAASLDALCYRQRNAGDAFRGAFLKSSGVLVGFVCGTISSETTLEHAAMEIGGHVPEGTSLCIHSVVVDKAYRRKGVATAMLRDYVMAVPEAFPLLDRILLICKANLIHFYEMAAGFRFTRLWPHTHGRERWFEMKVDLAAMPAAHVDAFTSKAYEGNPAAVVMVPSHKPEPPDSWYVNVAGEMNLSETAFVRRTRLSEMDVADGKASYHLRWFTPTTEVDLCGHATLAAAHYLFSTGTADMHSSSVKCSQIIFSTKSGVLLADRTDGGIVLDFPAEVPSNSDLPQDAIQGLGIETGDIVSTHRNRIDCFIVVKWAAFNRINPDMAILKRVRTRGIIATTRNETNGKYHMISRCFFPSVGVDEDPVTGSAHCGLVPLWCARDGLVKCDYTCFQASKRGGVLRCEYDPNARGERITIRGSGIITLKSILLH